MANRAEARTDLILDTDGVLLPYAPIESARLPFVVTRLMGVEHYATEVVSRLGKLSVNLVWLTTAHPSDVLFMTDRMNDLKDGHHLGLPRLSLWRPRITQKLNALILYEATPARPFVWVDDEIAEIEIAKVDEKFVDTPHLVIVPDRNIGLDEQQLSSIEQFVANHS